jgi:hypothetical protein
MRGSQSEAARPEVDQVNGNAAIIEQRPARCGYGSQELVATLENSSQINNDT